MKLTYLFLTLFCTIIFFTACDPDDDIIINTAQEEADRIRANTPTELPPITTTGENTMGAWIIPQPGSELALAAGADSILFVASGVERIDPIGSSSTDCNAFQNYRYESERSINILGNWCPRPEIGDPHAQVLSLGLSDDDYLIIFFAFDQDGGSTVNELQYLSDTLRTPDYEILLDDTTNRLISIIFSAELVRSDALTETIRVSSGRLDATYGSTP